LSFRHGAAAAVRLVGGGYACGSRVALVLYTGVPELGPTAYRTHSATAGLDVIIVSKPSTDPTRPARTDRSTPVCRRSPVAHNDAPACAGRNESAFTPQRSTRSKSILHASSAPRLRDGPNCAQGSGSPGDAASPSGRRLGHSKPGRRRDGIPALSHPSLQTKQPPRRAVRVLLGGINRGQLRHLKVQVIRRSAGINLAR
jgi:hypothetical protein